MVRCRVRRDCSAYKDATRMKECKGWQTKAHRDPVRRERRSESVRVVVVLEGCTCPGGLPEGSRSGKCVVLFLVSEWFGSSGHVGAGRTYGARRAKGRLREERRRLQRR